MKNYILKAKSNIGIISGHQTLLRPSNTTNRHEHEL